MENTQETEDQPQCRICFDGEEAGRLIKPCLCRGSVMYVHVKCLQTWRTSSASDSAFFKCPQCGYSYRFARTRIFGIASNPIVIATGSSIIFTLLVLCSSFVTTSFISAFDDDDSARPTTYLYSSYGYGLFSSPFDIASDLIRAFLRIVKDEQGIIDDTLLRPSSTRAMKYDARAATDIPATPSSVMARFITHFLLGLPMVAAISLIQLLISVPILGPVRWIARYRNQRGRDSKDAAALIVLVLLAVGAARALYKVYRLTERCTKRLLLRAEEAILEVQ